MNTAQNTPDEDSTDRVEEITDTWESSPLTEPERAVDSKATSPGYSGTIDDSKTDLEREEGRASRSDY